MSRCSTGLPAPKLGTRNGDDRTRTPGMLLIGVIGLTIVWAAVVTVVIGLCVGVARADRDERRTQSLRPARERRFHPLRLSA
jgi:hypothetical protein